MLAQGRLILELVCARLWERARAAGVPPSPGRHIGSVQPDIPALFGFCLPDLLGQGLQPGSRRPSSLEEPAAEESIITPDFPEQHFI